MARITETVKVLLIINVIFFIGSMTLGDMAIRLFAMWFPENENFQVWQILTHMFMHGGFGHILFNMYGLWAFGSALEMKWGPQRFLFFYISAGLGAVALHIGIDYFRYQSFFATLVDSGLTPQNINELLTTGRTSGGFDVSQDAIDGIASIYRSPMLGASGAVYGVLVGFGMLFPNVELMLIFLPVPIKAKYFIPGLLCIDLFFGITGSPLNIAHWAHLGGALVGFLMVWYWKRNEFNKNRWD
ncbi:rhomboid family intramembrane serine protease [Gangjinia marincola]|uniref:Rhomboid family intramembrane serine protease n=1 Tax=Gangjinia marincola TaxID=578463 RepID=A0ABN1MIH4_9FLAO